MVAASKMRKAQDRMRAAPYAEKVRNIAAHLGQANPSTFTLSLKAVDVQRRPASSWSPRTRGLCGGMNTNVLRAVRRSACVTWTVGCSQAQGGRHRRKGLGFLNRVGAKVVAQSVGLGDTPHPG